MLLITDNELMILQGLIARIADPAAPPPAGPAPAPTFEEAAREWHAHMLSRWVPVHALEVITSLERDVFPTLGDKPLGEITAPMVLEAMRAIEARGALESARRVRQRVSMIYSFAIAKGMAATDPSAVVSRAMAQVAPRQNLAALLDEDDAKALLVETEALRSKPVIKLASRFLALTAVRLGAVRLAEWSEIEGLDGDNPLWRIPASHMKMTAAKKKVETNCHIVPLSRQAVEVLRAAVEQGDDDETLIFPGVGESALNALYKRTSFTGRHVPHGWRSSFSTIMNERYPEDRAVIDMALAHSPKDKVESAYNRAAHLARRRVVFQRWADLVMPLKS